MISNFSMNATNIKRIKKEYDNLTKDFNVTNLSIQNVENKTIKTIKITFSVNKNFYEVEYTSSYPFRIPQVTFNHKPKGDFYNLCSERFYNTLLKLYNWECMCCHSILCPNNWMVGHQISHIVREFQEYKQMKMNIAYKILADKIKDKYLIDDIDLDCWLF